MSMEMAVMTIDRTHTAEHAGAGATMGGLTGLAPVAS